MMDPRIANGKVCYIEIPAIDIKRSVDFYRNVFGWSIRQRGDGSIAFDDGVEVSGTWVLGRKAAAEPGFMIYIMVADIKSACDSVIASGGQIVHSVGPTAKEQIARFRDPAGNVVGLYQESKLSR